MIKIHINYSKKLPISATYQVDLPSTYDCCYCPTCHAARVPPTCPGFMCHTWEIASATTQPPEQGVMKLLASLWTGCHPFTRNLNAHQPATGQLLS